MNVYLFAAVILLLPALCTALGAAGVFLVRRADEPRTRRMLCGMAAGYCRSGWPRRRGWCWVLWACCGWKRLPGG